MLQLKTRNNTDSRQRILQAKLKVGRPGDKYEQEADAVAGRVMRMGDSDTMQMQPVEEEEEMLQPKLRMQPIEEEEEMMQPKIRMQENEEEEEAIQTKCAECEQEEMLQAKSEKNSGFASPSVSQQIRSSRGYGSPLTSETNKFMSNAFGTDFSGVTIHTGSNAIQMNRSLKARAFTHGSDIYFNKGEYKPESSQGKRLLAHELTHVVQQKGMMQKSLQKTSNFCTPYATATEAANAEWWLRNTYMRLEGIETFGTEVYNLYDSYLNRRPGDSLTPRIFNSSSSYIHNSFKDDGYIKDDMDAVIKLVNQRLHRAPIGSIRAGVQSVMSLSNFLSVSEMNNRPINFSNPFSVSGHIAGDIGRSNAGPDYRKITRANVAITKVVLFGNTGYHLIELIPHYEVFDTIDFCPGDPGSPAESLVTTPMSRLEASGAAYDMPFKVIFSPTPRSKRFWF